MPHGIYDDEFAALCKEDAGQQWEPSNGCEGEVFIESWCGECRRDKVANGSVRMGDESDDDFCPILNASYRGEAAEWQYGPDGQPRCTAFEPLGEPGCARCLHTMELKLTP